MLKYKEVKQKYKKNFQRAKFNGVKKFKKLRYSRPKGRLVLMALNKCKSSSRQMLSAHGVITKYLKKRKVHVWSRVYPDFADFYKTKGVRMGGGRGKHFRFKLRFFAGAALFEVAPRGSLKKKTEYFVKNAGKKLGVRTKFCINY